MVAPLQGRPQWRSNYVVPSSDGSSAPVAGGGGWDQWFGSKVDADGGDNSLTVATPIGALGDPRTLATRFADEINVEDQRQSIDADDTNAWRRAIDKIMGLPNGGTIVGGGRDYNVSGALTAEIGARQSLVIRGRSGRNITRFIVAAAFTGTLLTATIDQTSGAYGPLDRPAVHIKGLTFVHQGSSIEATGVVVQAGATITGTAEYPSSPSVVLDDLSFLKAGTGYWQYCAKIYALSVTYCNRIHCSGMLSGSTGINYDTDGRIAVQHWNNHCYFNGQGGTGVNMGRGGSDLPDRGGLQGFTFDSPSFTGVDFGITTATNDGMDQIIVTGAQIDVNTNSATNAGIKVQNAATIIVQNCYFLGCPYGIYAVGGCSRLIINGNQFLGGGAANLTAIRLTNNFPLLQGGTIITGNQFSNYAPISTPPAAGQPGAGGSPIVLDGATDWVTVTGNDFVTGAFGVDQGGPATVTGLPLCVDATGLVGSANHNCIGPNSYDGILQVDTPFKFRSNVEIVGNLTVDGSSEVFLGNLSVAGTTTTQNLTINGAMQLPKYTVASLPLGSGEMGWAAYVTNGRKTGEAAGAGTGVLAFHDSSGWISVMGGAVAA